VDVLRCDGRKIDRATPLVLAVQNVVRRTPRQISIAPRPIRSGFLLQEATDERYVGVERSKRQETGRNGGIRREAGCSQPDRTGKEISEQLAEGDQRDVLELLRSRGRWV
jgi:hypothetical protein